MTKPALVQIMAWSQCAKSACVVITMANAVTAELIDDFAQDCSIPIVNTLEIPQSCAKTSSVFETTSAHQLDVSYLMAYVEAKFFV